VTPIGSRRVGASITRPIQSPDALHGMLVPAPFESRHRAWRETKVRMNISEYSNEVRTMFESDSLTLCARLRRFGARFSHCRSSAMRRWRYAGACIADPETLSQEVPAADADGEAEPYRGVLVRRLLRLERTFGRDRIGRRPRSPFAADTSVDVPFESRLRLAGIEEAMVEGYRPKLRNEAGVQTGRWTPLALCGRINTGCISSSRSKTPT
jgi:hypothetical protein